MADSTLTASRQLTTGGSQFNALNFLMERILAGQLNTASPVIVVGVSPGAVGPVGTVDVLPLVSQIDASGKGIPPQTIYSVPYSRIQGGIAALIIDPLVGDVGWCVFCQRDISGVQTGASAPVQPGSFRMFDQSDAIYLGGILNKIPEIYLELTQEGVATLKAPQKIILEAPQVAINASESCTITSPVTNITGQLNTGTDGGGAISMNGNISHTGSMTSTGDHVAGGISLDNHVHSGIEPGSGNTDKPNG